MVMALSIFSSGSFQSASTVSQCYQSCLVQYEDFSEQNIDETTISTSPLAQMYLILSANNEVYNLLEMLTQHGTSEFIKAVHEEVSSMPMANIWETVLKQEILDYYSNERLKGKEIKRHQLMMICSFKRKRNLDGTLTKYKSRLCWHGGQ